MAMPEVVTSIARPLLGNLVRHPAKPRVTLWEDAWAHVCEQWLHLKSQKHPQGGRLFIQQVHVKPVLAQPESVAFWEIAKNEGRRESFDQFSLMESEIAGSFLVSWFGNTSFIVVKKVLVWEFGSWTEPVFAVLVLEESTHRHLDPLARQPLISKPLKIQNTHTLSPFALQAPLRVQWIPDMYRVKKYWTQVSFFQSYFIVCCFQFIKDKNSSYRCLWKCPTYVLVGWLTYVRC